MKNADTPLGEHPDPDIITTDALADLVGVTAQQIGALTRAGVLKTAARGRYARRDTLRAYCADLRKKAMGRSAGDYSSAKARAATAQAVKLETQNAVATGQLVAAADVEKAWASILRDLRAAMLAVPSRVGSRVPTLTPYDIGQINREITDALAALADADGPQAGETALG